jgi:hypothetical protein
MLRNLIVMDVQVDDDDVVSVRTTRRNGKEIMVRTDVTILPQGKRGVLPNTSLVFVVGKLFDKSLCGKTRSAIQVPPFWYIHI